MTRRRTTSHPPAAETVPLGTCVACARGGCYVHPVGEGDATLLICVDPGDCRKHWPEVTR